VKNDIQLCKIKELNGTEENTNYSPVLLPQIGIWMGIYLGYSLVDLSIINDRKFFANLPAIWFYS
jgi:hypothetical protein